MMSTGALSRYPLMQGTDAQKPFTPRDRWNDRNDDLRLAAETTVPVLIVSASPALRWHLARWIHERSERRAEPYVAIGAGGTSSSSMTAVSRQARGGTLFIDALECLAAWPQRRLFRLLEARSTVTPRSLGQQCSVRLIAGADPSLREAIAAHRISERLFYRVSIIRIDAALA